MIDIQEIQEEINRIEQEETSYQNCMKLSVLYSVLDHNSKPERFSDYSYGSSEFLLSVQNAPIDEVLSILDEHMDAVRLLYPKEYNQLIEKIRVLTTR